MTLAAKITLRRKRVALVLGVVCLLAVGSRTCDRREELIATREGRELKVTRQQGAWRSFGLPHSIVVGGGGDYERLQFNGVNGDSFVWSLFGDCRPFIVEYVEKVAYVACYSRETYGRESFRLFASTDGAFEEVPREAFPRNLVQNTWLRHLSNVEKDAIRDQDPQQMWFRRSLTALLWFYLETGGMATEVDAGFLERYKRKYL